MYQCSVSVSSRTLGSRHLYGLGLIKDVRDKARVVALAIKTALKMSKAI